MKPTQVKLLATWNTQLQLENTDKVPKRAEPQKAQILNISFTDLQLSQGTNIEH